MNLTIVLDILLSLNIFYFIVQIVIVHLIHFFKIYLIEYFLLTFCALFTFQESNMFRNINGSSSNEKENFKEDNPVSNIHIGILIHLVLNIFMILEVKNNLRIFSSPYIFMRR